MATRRLMSAACSRADKYRSVPARPASPFGGVQRPVLPGRFVSDWSSCVAVSQGEEPTYTDGGRGPGSRLRGRHAVRAARRLRHRGRGRRAGRPALRERRGQREPRSRSFHDNYGKAGFKFLVAAWSIEYSGGPSVSPRRGTGEAHEDLEVSERGFDVVRTEIKNTLYDAGVPHEEMREFMGGIDVFRDDVVADEHRDEDWEAP